MTYRERMSQKTKEKIIKTANRLFRKDGYDNVTVRGIISAAGVSNGAFYAHFKSKESLIAETLFYLDEVYLDYYKNELCSDAYTGRSALEKLELFILQVNRIIATDGPETVSLYMSYAIKNPALLKRDNRNYLSILHELISDCREKHLINGLYTDGQLADMLLYLNRSITIEWAVQNGSYPIEDKDELVRILINQIKA